MIELREAEIDVLVGKGLLNSETRHDPRAVTESALCPSRSNAERSPMTRSSTVTCNECFAVTRNGILGNTSYARRRSYAQRGDRSSAS
jgi:hypothetical protein